MIRPIIFGALLWGATFYALRRGGTDERIAAVGMFANAYLTLLVVKPLATRFTHIELPIMLVDFGLLVLLLWLALRSNRFWPLWLAAMQFLATFAHFAPYVPHIIPWGYGSAVALWMYPMLIVVTVASHGAHEERKRHGSLLNK